MKAISVFKKAAIPLAVILLILVMAIAIIPKVAAEGTSDLTAPKVVGKTLALSGNVNFVVYFREQDTLDNNAYVQATIGDKVVAEYTKEDLLPKKGATDTRWAVRVPLAPAQLTEEIIFQWYDENGVKIGEPTTPMSAKTDYIDKVLKLAVNGTEEQKKTYGSLVEPLKSLLNYGAMAQTQFNINKENPANDKLYAENSNPIDGMLAEHLYDAKSVELKDATQIDFIGANAYLESSVTLRIYFTAPEGATATISDGGKPRQVYIREDEHGKYVNINNIAAHNFSKVYTVTVTVGEGEAAQTATAKCSVLGYVLETLDGKATYRLPENQKNTARSLYLYYTWMKSYVTKSEYTPGPKQDDGEGNLVSVACTHVRSHLEGIKVVCSDCGHVREATKIIVSANQVELLANTTPAPEVEFTISVAGTVNLKALSITLAGEGLTFEYVKDSLTFGGSEGNLGGEAGLNVVLDAAEAITNAGTLATVKYKVTAKEAGIYKIVPTINEAYGVDSEGNNADIINTITTSHVALNVTLADCEHIEGYMTSATKHKSYCDTCKVIREAEDHTAGTWSHVIEAKGGKVTGELYEVKACTACNYAVETREVYYKNNIDSVKVNDTVINPHSGNKGQTTGVIFHEDPGYATFVITPENFIWSEIVDGKVVEGTTIPLTFKDTDSFKTGGWFGVNGGVERYVIRINDGAWKTLAGTPGSTKPENTTGIGGAINNNANITDKVGAHTNSSYQGGLAYHDFEEYAGQTIKVTLGAVPAGNPGTEENPNVLITAVIENLFVTCTHLAQNLTYDATESPTVFNVTCVCGDTYTTSDINDEALKMFNADEIVYRGAGQGGSNYSITKMTENGLDFARFELTREKANDKEFLYYFANANTGNATNLTYGLSDTFMIVYRANKAYPGTLTLYLNQGAWKSQAYSIKDDSQWHVALYDLSTLYDDTYGHLNTIRFDIFDAVAIEKGAIIDIAYMGFFKDQDHALENYKRAAEKHEAIGKAANWALNLDNFLVDETGYKGKNPPITNDGGGQFGCVQVDLKGYTVKTVDSSITFRGWLVTPFGAEGIYYTITDAEGNVSERRFYLKPSVISATNGIVGATTSYRYGTERLNGSAFQSTTNTFNLTGYEGKTVSIDVILVNNIGQEGTIMQIKNVSVPYCANHVLYTVEAKASTCTVPGNEAYQTCDSCQAIKYFDLNGAELEAIPEIAINPEAHNKVDYTWTAPTTTEDGHYAHKACTICGKAWNTENIELDAVPTIAKLVPTTNKYVGYDDMKDWTISDKVDTKPAEDRSYVRFERNQKCGDQYALFMSGNKEVTGKYMIIKYRTDHIIKFQFFVNTEGGVTAAANFYTQGLPADEKWHIAVIDMAARMGTSDYFKAEEDGSYIVQSARIDLLDASASEGYIDLGFIALTDDITKISSILLDGDTEICPHKVADDAVWTPIENEPAYSAKSTCIICGGEVKKQVDTTTNGLHIFTPEDIYNNIGQYGTGFYVVRDENGMPYINVTYSGATTSGEQSVYLYKNTSTPITNIGGYVAVLYRTSNANNRIEVVADSTLSYVLKGVCQFPTASTRAGKWTLAVKKYNAYGTADTASSGYYNGEKFTTFRLDYFNTTIANGDTVDIAFVAYFSSEAEAYDYFAEYVKAYGNESWCEHKFTSTTWISAEKIYKTTCDICGKVTSTSDMLYKTEGEKSNVASQGGYLTATQEDGFVRYTAGKRTDNNNNPSDPYFYPFYNNTTNVTGQYMVIKYRVNNNGKNMTTEHIFASSAAHGRGSAAGNSGDSSNVHVTSSLVSNSLFADGNWHCFIITPDLAKNQTFTKNADGTYTWKYCRIRLVGFAAYDGSCSIDIDEIAFADNLEAAELYAAKNGPLYQWSVDNGTATGINGVEKTKLPFVGSARATNGAQVVDMKDYETVNLTNGIGIGGWFITPGGVDKYGYRVTSVDGVAVKNPAFIDYWESTTIDEDNEVTKIGVSKGWTTDCRKGARLNGHNWLDLSAYQGKTVTVEVVAITNYGAEITFVRVINVNVAEQ